MLTGLGLLVAGRLGLLGPPGARELLVYTSRLAYVCMYMYVYMYIYIYIYVYMIIITILNSSNNNNHDYNTFYHVIVYISRLARVIHAQGPC